MGNKAGYRSAGIGNSATVLGLVKQAASGKGQTVRFAGRSKGEAQYIVTRTVKGQRVSGKRTSLSKLVKRYTR